MTILPRIDHTPGAMSRRARVYITAGGSRHFLIGLSMVLTPWMYSAAAFIPIFNLVNQAWWAWIMIVVGLVCLVGSITRQPEIARAGMIGSAVVTLVLAAGLTIGIANVWLAFAQVLGSDRLWELLYDRPPLYPLDLVRVVVAPPSPFLALLLISVSVKDFTMCAQPLRVPAEDRVEVAKLRRA